MGSKIIKMDPAQGFSSQGSGAAVVLTASHLGYPLSTTHVISGGIMGAGAAKRLSAVRWGVAGNIAVAWLLTLPAAAAIGAAAYGVISIFGPGAAGPLVVTFCCITLLLAIFGRRAVISRQKRLEAGIAPGLDPLAEAGVEAEPKVEVKA